MPKSKSVETSAGSLDTEAQLAFFIGKFDPTTADLIRRCRARLRVTFSTANEIVYDNYNFFVIGYSPTLRTSDTIVSLAAAANGVGLSFYHGANLPDPSGILLGNGKQNRFVRLPSAEVLESEKVAVLINAAVQQSRIPLPAIGSGATIIKSVSAKQRSRQRSASTHRSED